MGTTSSIEERHTTNSSGWTLTGRLRIVDARSARQRAQTWNRNEERRGWNSGGSEGDLPWTIELARARGCAPPVDIDDLDNVEGCKLRLNGWV